jgi:hypothetical protein
VRQNASQIESLSPAAFCGARVLTASHACTPARVHPLVHTLLMAADDAHRRRPAPNYETFTLLGSQLHATSSTSSSSSSVTVAMADQQQLFNMCADTAELAEE